MGLDIGPNISCMHAQERFTYSKELPV